MENTSQSMNKNTGNDLYFKTIPMALWKSSQPHYRLRTHLAVSKTTVFTFKSESDFQISKLILQVVPGILQVSGKQKVSRRRPAYLLQETGRGSWWVCSGMEQLWLYWNIMDCFCPWAYLLFSSKVELHKRKLLCIIFYYGSFLPVQWLYLKGRNKII